MIPDQVDAESPQKGRADGAAAAPASDHRTRGDQNDDMNLRHHRCSSAGQGRRGGRGRDRYLP